MVTTCAVLRRLSTPAVLKTSTIDYRSTIDILCMSFRVMFLSKQALSRPADTKGGVGGAAGLVWFLRSQLASQSAAGCPVLGG